ncbi:hypothetical protein [Haloarcula sediminis]|uniref:hypothetical protein n=1 Tax=Haloarcula sediminis TaxID=3111777 RepID=UPI002D76B609|nr:hypothetical protein [Haloarcula sp. CK38]
MDWIEQADGLLYDGESVQERVPVGAGGVVVTSHRLLAFTPDREGANFSQVDRPNVDGVEVRTGGEFRFLERAVKAIVVGVALLVAGFTVSLDGMVEGVSLESGGAGSAAGIGRMLGLLGTMLDLLARLDDLMRVFGGLALAFGAVVLAVYLWSRERLLVVAVAGGDDIELAAPDDEAALGRLRTALGSAPERADAPTDDAVA